ncbi:putative bifunctional diguanylate cyclase/phosphodiesterase, partial [Arsukibacterium sp.]|uniref:putative bifunctional diguanylate cyclase/phosphodiesterase n=1 Tax=Arsukibacterium sp. TaxID=1977258 RepID=UPI002FD92F4D
PLGLLFTPFISCWWLRRRYQHQLSSLQASEQQLTTLLNTVDAYIYIKDLKLRYQYVNPKVAQLFQRTPEQVIGHSDFLFFDSQTAAILQVNDQRVLQGGERIVEEEPLTTTDGKKLTCLVVKIPLRDAKGNIYALCGIATDISEHKQSQAAIHHLAFYDALTELPNRRLFLERLAQAHQLSCRLPQTGAVLFIDLDHFKDLNDTLGHAVGDQLLQQVAKRLAEQLRKTDTLARFGGDEFVVLVTDLQAKSELASLRVEVLANKLLQCLISDFTLAERQYSISASIGIAMFDDAASVDELLQRADLAMYDAKNRGRNQLCFFNHQMQAQASERTQLLAGLRQALNEQQFFLHLQGQYDSQGQLLGAEVLLRWQYAEHGLISPADFIPLAESSNLIIPIGNWVLRQSCEILAQWRYMTQRQHWHLSVNISVRQLQATNFVSTVADILQSTGADGANLVLELTESQLLEDVEQVINTMQQLRQLGVQFSLDDFGTGYSSLSYLKRLPLSQLKIDRSFVRDILIDSNDEAIVKTILALGEALELQVIAEGVESAAQHQALTMLGCQQFQGYYFARPSLLQDLKAQWQPPSGPQSEPV